MRRINKRIILSLMVLLVLVLLPVFGMNLTDAKTKVKVNSITITQPSKKSLTLKVGSTYQTKVRVAPSNATVKKVSYKSSNSKIVSVSASGKLTAKSKGTAKITVTAMDGSKKNTVLTVNSVVPVNKVTIINPAEGNFVLSKGKSYTLKTAISPTNANNKSLSYSSSNKNVATVSASGKITAKNNGKAKITVKAKDGSGKLDTVNIVVGYPVKGISINPKSISKPVGYTYKFNAVITPSNASIKALEYTSSNKTLATVDKSGKVSLKKAGKVTITAAATDGSGKKASLVITITTPVKSITLKETSVTKNVGTSYQIVPTVLPSNATNKKLSYSSSNTAIATVDINGKVSLKKAGTVKITASANDGSGVKAICTITVKDPYEGYTLKWKDDFDGTKLDTKNWNYELHDPGWVNNELQRYTDSDENIFVKDGELTLKAIKNVDKDGKVSYTSGRVNTQNKQDFKYGRFEARIKSPSGKGFLPAFWMMPTDESLYGQWPKCGEIDIMEVLGDKTNKAYGTLHFGEPHTQKQGSYTLDKGDFANEYHVYTCDWEPNEMRFYIDGVLYHTVNDWFSKKSGFGEVTYPAPFDQPFYMIFNLAVGGNWPGNPDDTTAFGKNAEFKVDYVKVYQKDSYNEDVEKPITEVTLRDPDATGNYINNGDFSVNESLSDNKNWGFLLAGDGAATAKIANKELIIDTTNSGGLDYSVQVVQPDLPMKKGYRYRVTFDAYAAEDRTMITDVSAPDNGYIRYLSDTITNLTTKKKTYTYEFDMLNNSDPNGRLEFNLGNQKSTAQVRISNVRVEQIGKAVIPPEVKSVLPDGNYVYNGAFQEGTKRLAYWTISNQFTGTTVSVTNTNNVRELKTFVPSGITDITKVILSQDQIAIAGGKSYILSFDAYGDNAQTIQTLIGGNTFSTTLTNKKTTYKYSFTTEDVLKDDVLKFLLGVAGTTYIDNVRIQEDGLFINGDFSNGKAGYDFFVDSSLSSMVESGVVALNENNAAFFNIKDTGDADWKIQLKQNNVKLDAGKWYKISFDAKSTIDRSIMYALQKDGSVDNDWTPYTGSKVIDLTGEFQNYSYEFQMSAATDPKTIFSISMGSVGGKRITQEHLVYIDNINLVEVEAPGFGSVDIGTDLIKNGDFTKLDENWVNAVSSPGEAVAKFDQGKVTYEITNPGSADWNVQLKQNGLLIENGSTYKVKFKVKSTKARTVKFALLSTIYSWYGGADIAINANEEYSFESDVIISKDTDPAIDFVLSMGKIDGQDTPASTVEISEISLVKIK